MPIEGVTVQKIIEPKLLGVFKAHNVYLCTGKYGEYLRHNSLNYSIPQWAKMENLNEPFGIVHASNIIDWKIRNKVPRGEAVCKKIVISSSNLLNSSSILLRCSSIAFLSKERSGGIGPSMIGSLKIG